MKVPDFNTLQPLLHKKIIYIYSFQPIIYYLNHLEATNHLIYNCVPLNFAAAFHPTFIILSFKKCLFHLLQQKQTFVELFAKSPLRLKKNKNK